MQTEKSSARAGTVLFACLFLIASLLLLSQMGSETKFSARGQLFAQPRTWPAIGVGGMVLFALGMLFNTWRLRLKGTGTEALQWAKPVEYLVWFMVYVSAVPIIGYLLASVLFTTLLAFRLGYRKPSTLLMAATTGCAIVLVFKTGLSVKIPGGMVYDYLPSDIRNFMIINL